MFVAEVDSGTKLIHGFWAPAVWATTVLANHRVSRQSGFMNTLPGSTRPTLHVLACSAMTPVGSLVADIRSRAYKPFFSHYQLAELPEIPRGPRQFSIFFFSAACWTISLLIPFRLTRVVKSSALNGYW